MKRCKQINIRLTNEEFYRLKLEAKNLNITYTELILSRVFNYKNSGDLREFLDFIKQEDYSYNKIGNNINQIARILNTERILNKTEYDIILNSINELIEAKNKFADGFNNLLEKL